jgi:hypothetical protein
MWQSILVGLIVLLASLYAAWALLPAGPRRRLAQAVADWTRGQGRPAWLARAGAALQSSAQRRLGDCEDCGSAQQRSPTRSSRRQPPTG